MALKINGIRVAGIGSDGKDGVGVVAGGTTGQVLIKKTDTDYDTEWASLPSIDSTLSIEGQAADAKATGGALNQLQANIDDKLDTMQLDIDSKVNAVDGMGLSTNDYTNADKERLANAALIDDVNTKYTKPETGIPESDFSVDVQGYLALANTALQEHQDISGKLDTTAQAADSAKLNGEFAEYYLDYNNFANVPTIPSIEDLATELQIAKLQSDIDTKVDKVEGKGLSTEDYTTSEKDKLATIEANANFYEHPTHDSHNLGLYKVTVDDSGHVSGATLAEKEDIVALGIPAENTVYDDSKLSGRIGDAENNIIIINRELEKISKGFDGYKESNDKAVSTNTSNIEANKLAIEILNGEGDGSVKKSIDNAIDNAFNEFAANVTNDDVVNTYKELIDYAATHGPEFATLVGEVDTIKTNVGEFETDFSNYQTEVSEQFTDVDKAINNHVTNTNNPHSVTKEQVGLANVDDTSDLDKPISYATQEALDEKADVEHIHEVGEVDGLQDLVDELQLNIDNHIENNDNPHAVTAEQVGAYTIDEVDTKVASLEVLVDTDDEGILLFNINMLEDASEVLV